VLRNIADCTPILCSTEQIFPPEGIHVFSQDLTITLERLLLQPSSSISCFAGSFRRCSPIRVHPKSKPVLLLTGSLVGGVEESPVYRFAVDGSWSSRTGDSSTFTISKTSSYED